MFGHNEIKVGKSSQGGSDKKKDKVKKSSALAPSDYYQLYWDHYKAYLYGQSSQGPSALNDLYQASQYLCKSAMLGYRKALDAIKTSHQEPLLAHELLKIIDLEFAKRLQKEPASGEFLETHLMLFMLFYSRRYESIYSDYDIRFEEIYQALLSLNQCHILNKDNHNPVIECLAKYLLISRQDPLDESALTSSAWKILTMEMMGLDPLADTLKQIFPKKLRPNAPYPFRILPRIELEEKLGEFVLKNKKAITKTVKVIEKYIETQVTTILCSAYKPNHYVLHCTAKVLNDKFRLICYVDEKSGLEIARFEMTDHHLRFKAYGYSIHLKMEGTLQAPACFFENPKSELTLSADWNLDHALYLSADVDRLQYVGQIKLSQPLKLDIRGELVFDSSSELNVDSSIAIRASALSLQGKMASKGICQLEVDTVLIAGPESQCQSSAGIMISAGSLKDVRGQLTSATFLKIDASDGVYLHGAATLYAPSVLAITAKSLMSTDKAILKTEGLAHIDVKTLLAFDKESSCSAPKLVMRSRIFKNYSSITADTAMLYSKEDMINYPSGIVTTKKSLQMTGGSVWNGGQLNFGDSFSLKLNKIFSHGVIDLSELYHLKKVIGRSRIIGGDVSITAGAFVNCVGTMIVRNLQVAALAEFNIGLTVSKSTRKSRLLAIDVGLDVPNLSQICRDMHDFVELIKKGSYSAVKEVVFSEESTLKIVSFLRWVIRTIFPLIGKPIDTIFGALIFIRSLPKLYSECVRLYQLDKDVLEPSDLYALMAIVSNLSIQGVTAIPQSIDFFEDYFSSTPSESKDEVKAESKSQTTSRLIDNMPDLMLDFAAIFLPSCTDDALLSAKIGGFHSGTSLLNRSILTYEMGSTEISLSIADIFYFASQQDGFVIAKNISSTGRILDQSRILVGSHLFTNVEKQFESSTVYAKDVVWQADELTEKAEVKADQIQLEVKGHLALKGHLVVKKEVTLHGGTIETDKESKIKGGSVVILAEQDEKLSGIISSHVALLQAKSNNLDIEQSAVITVDEVRGIAGKNLTDFGVIKINETASAPLGDDGKPTPAVSLVGKSVLTTADSSIEAKGKIIVAQGSERVGLGGNIDAHAVYAEAKTGDLDLDKGSKITADEVHGIAGQKLTDSGAIKINETASAPLDDDGKPTPAVSLRGRSVETTESSDIGATKKDVLIEADEEATLGGKMTAHRIDGSVKSGHINVTEKSHVTGKQVYYEAKSIDYAGTTFLQDESAASPDDTGPFFITRSSTLHMGDQGHIDTDSKESVISLKAASGSLGGHIQAPILEFQIDTLSNLDVENLLQRTGRYSDVAPSDSLAISTSSALTLDREMNFSYSVSLTGSSVDVISNIYSSKDISLTSTIGDVSAQHCMLRADHLLAIDAKHSFRNERGSLFADTMLIHARDGDIINRVGILQASNYLELKTEHGDIQNLCIESDVRGAYDTLKSYQLGRMLGGTGAGHDGIGFYADAGGKFIDDASEISSIGGNYIVGRHGVDLEAHKHTYVSFYRHTRSWYGRETEKTDYSTQVQPSLIYSVQGKNTVISTDGGIHSVATQMVAASGTDLESKGNIDLYGIKGEERQYRSSSNLWGLAGRSRAEACDDFVVPTTFASLGDVHIVALGDINARCASITTPGHLAFKGHNVYLSGEVLDHHSFRDTWSWNFVGPSLPCLNGASVYQDLQSFGSTSSSMGRAAVVSNTLIDGLNSFNGIVGGMRSGSLTQAVFPFSTMTVGQAELSHTVSKSSWQTLAPNVGYQCGSLSIDAENTLSFSKGISIYVVGDAKIRAKLFEQSGVGLKSSTHTVSESLGLGVSAEGSFNGSASLGISGSESTTYAHQNFYVGGALDVDVDIWDITDANVIAGSLTGHVKRLSVLTHSDTSSSYSYSAQISTNGSYSYHQDTDRSATISTPSGIEVREKTDFEAKETYLEGSKLLFDGETHFRTDHLTSRMVDEYNHSSSFGLCGNVNDLVGDTNSRQWTQPIPSIGIHRGRQDYVAEQMGTVWSSTGGVSIQSVDGTLHTTDTSGLMVRRSEQDSYEFKMPLYHAGGLTQLKDNVGWARDRIFSTMHAPKEHGDTESKEILVERKPALHPSSHTKETKHHERTLAEDKILDEAEITIERVDKGLKAPVGLTSSELTLFSHRSSRWPVHGGRTLTSKWEGSRSSPDKWQSSRDEVKTEHSLLHDSFIIRDESYRIIRNTLKEIWSETKKDVTDFIHGDFSEKKEAAIDLGKKGLLASAFIFSRGSVEAVEAEEMVMSSAVGRLGMWKRGSFVPEDVISKHPLAGLSPENVVRLTDELGVKTLRDQLVLWSGLGRGDAGIKLSQEYAVAHGGVTLEMTEGGKWLHGANLFGENSPFTYSESMQIWGKVSQLAARQASGQVRAAVGSVCPTSIYQTVEVPELLINKHVIGIDELNLKPKFNFQLK